MKKYCFLYILLFSLPCLAESTVNLSQDTTIKEPHANSPATHAVINHISEEQSPACACDNSRYGFGDTPINLSQYKTIKELYADDAIHTIRARIGKEKERFTSYHTRDFGYTVLISQDKGTIHRTHNGLYFGKSCYQNNCDIFLQKQGHKTIFVIDRLVRSFNIFYKDPLSEEEVNKILSEAQEVMLHNINKSKQFTLELNFFNQ